MILQRENGYIIFSGAWKDVDEIKLTEKPKLEKTVINSKVSLCYANYVLAADTSKTKIDFTNEDFKLCCNDDGDIIFSVLPTEDDEKVRISAKTNLGDLVLTDYSSAGQDGKSIISVWFKAE